MKKTLILISILITTMAACGGGDGSNPGPTPGEVVDPTTLSSSQRAVIRDLGFYSLDILDDVTDGDSVSLSAVVVRPEKVRGLIKGFIQKESIDLAMRKRFLPNTMMEL